MYKPNIAMLALAVWALSGSSPVQAASVGTVYLGPNAPAKGQTDPKPVDTIKETSPKTYLFINQDELLFNDMSPLDSGLSPASGEDETDPQEIIVPSSNKKQAD